MARSAPTIDGYGAGGFRLSGEWHAGSLLILGDEARAWPVTPLAEVNRATLAPVFWAVSSRRLPVLAGRRWDGLLWAFNLGGAREMPEIPVELNPAVYKFIAAEAMFWFRWSALATWVMGVILAWDRGFLLQAYTL